MSKIRVLIITQEMQPYLNGPDIGDIARALPQYIQDQGSEIRVLMPRYGVINERRHRLHEVVRLSGMNIILNDGVYIKTDGTVDKKRYEIAKRLYKKLKNEGKEFSYIDIRFEDYIVK